MRDGCVFCDYEGPSKILHETLAAYVIEPMFPVTVGHVLVVSKAHAQDFTTHAGVSGAVMVLAAQYAERNMGDCNLIASRGPLASQTIAHLHVHLVPRRRGDDLLLPWSGRQLHA